MKIDLGAVPENDVAVILERIEPFYPTRCHICLLGLIGVPLFGKYEDEITLAD